MIAGEPETPLPNGLTRNDLPDSGDRMTRRTKWYIAGGVLVALALWAPPSPLRPADPRASRCAFQPVERRDLVASVTASGQVQPHTKVDMSADISGRIIELPIKEGQMVTRGQLLVQIDPATYEAAVERSKAAVAAARRPASPVRGQRGPGRPQLSAVSGHPKESQSGPGVGRTSRAAADLTRCRQGDH